ncbi:hypothetical protein P7K49_022128 [Saguinus oedipus]|uniref:Uncharacterized protein n=1 Tax=Saguinus oedipus TaxID=9490 RepID=A0ABQ9UVG3_SAGOE|nr:hypothetical protein P7K49_022128 [Saguinus oedipus]
MQRGRAAARTPPLSAPPASGSRAALGEDWSTASGSRVRTPRARSLSGSGPAAEVPACGVCPRLCPPGCACPGLGRFPIHQAELQGSATSLPARGRTAHQPPAHGQRQFDDMLGASLRRREVRRQTSDPLGCTEPERKAGKRSRAGQRRAGSGAGPLRFRKAW